MTKNCVMPYSEGKNAWKADWYSFFIRKRGLVISTFISLLLLTSKPWWYPKSFPTSISLSWIITALLLSFIPVLYYLRRRTMRSLEIKSILHDLSHKIRDNHSKWFEILYSHKKSITEESYIMHFEALLGIIQRYFIEITNDKTIGVALRIAVASQNDENVMYKTIARIGLNSKRDETSEPIPANEGLPNYLIKKHEKCKVVIYYNLEEAIINDVFKKTKSEEVYPNDITTMMVAPLNAWDGKKRNRMIGILYITSKKEKIFEEKHVDSMRFIADVVAETVSTTTELLKSIFIKEKGKSYVIK
jgi:transcriptional regulator with GAF, ATPase, and Fis domain